MFFLHTRKWLRTTATANLWSTAIHICIYIFLLPARAWSRLTLTLLACQNPLASYPNETSNSFGEWCPIPSLFTRSRRTYLHVAFSLFNIRFCNMRLFPLHEFGLGLLFKIVSLDSILLLATRPHSAFALSFVISYIYILLLRSSFAHLYSSAPPPVNGRGGLTVVSIPAWRDGRLQHSAPYGSASSSNSTRPFSFPVASSSSVWRLGHRWIFGYEEYI